VVGTTPHEVMFRQMSNYHMGLFAEIKSHKNAPLPHSRTKEQIDIKHKIINEEF
jgi:hypothetical protein